MDGIAPSVVLLTGEGVGAVAVVRVFGPGALACVDAVFRSVRGTNLDSRALGKPLFGRIGRGMGDEVVVIAEPDEVEIHCHGGPAAIELVMEALVEAGARRDQASRSQTDRSASRIQTEALEDVSQATTLRTAAHLLDQVNGALKQASEKCDVAHLMDQLLASAEVGLRLVNGWKVALAGRPNVGKSRLMNALAGFDRSIVSESAGTTRDYVSLRTAFDGWPVELIDTAGLRSSDDPLESAGIALARSVQAEADLVLMVLDRSQPLTDEDHALIEAHPNALIVMNKCDLPGVWERQGVAGSAARGDGIAELGGLIARRLVPHPPQEGAPLLFRPWQVEAIQCLKTANPDEIDFSKFLK